MAKIVSFAKTLRNHWKKSIAGTLIISYGINYGVEKYQTLAMMRKYCKKARILGEEPLPTGKKPRHLTVILNPSSKDGKGKALYEKYAAPLFHLAGIRTSVVQTEAEGEAKRLMEVMDNTDAIVVAGGDGSLSEAVTGLLRRMDREVAVKRFPIGILPLGKTNTVAKALFWQEGFSDVRWIVEAAMAIVYEFYKPFDVMHIQGDSGNSVFAMGKFDWGAFRDSEAKISKYWFWGPLKARMAFLASALTSWPPLYEAVISYTPPCSGCSKCTPLVEMVEKKIDANKRWWHAFIKTTEHHQSPRQDFSHVVNKKCGIWQSEKYTSIGFNITTVNVEADKIRHAKPSLNVKLTGDNLSRTEFISEGLHHLQTGCLSDNQTFTSLQAKDIQFMPVLTKEEENWYSIDSEPFEVKPIVIKLLAKKVNMFCSYEH